LRAQGFWIKKEFQKWSAKECSKLLSDSPWAKSRTIAEVLIQPLGEPGAVPGRDEAPQITYIGRLWSAVPIRQAAVRLAQLSPAYSKLAPQERQAMETRQASLLAEKFPDSIVVRVEYSTTVPAYQADLAQYWQSRPADLWKQDMYLNAASGRHTPVDVRVAGGDGGVFELIFPREANGQPVVRLTDKSFSVEFAAPAIGRLPSGRVLLEFKLKDMALNGQPVF
jgi:hypothetical protein